MFNGDLNLDHSLGAFRPAKSIPPSNRRRFAPVPTNKCTWIDEFYVNFTRVLDVCLKEVAFLRQNWDFILHSLWSSPSITSEWYGSYRLIPCSNKQCLSCLSLSIKHYDKIIYSCDFRYSLVIKGRPILLVIMEYSEYHGLTPSYKGIQYHCLLIHPPFPLFLLRISLDLVHASDNTQRRTPSILEQFLLLGDPSESLFPKCPSLEAKPWSSMP